MRDGGETAAVHQSYSALPPLARVFCGFVGGGRKGRTNKRRVGQKKGLKTNGWSGTKHIIGLNTIDSMSTPVSARDAAS